MSPSVWWDREEKGRLMRYNRYSLRLKLSLLAREPLGSQQSLPTCQDTTPSPSKNARQRPTTSAITATIWAALVETAGCLTSDCWRKGQIPEIQEGNVLDQDNRLDAHTLSQTMTKKSPTPNLSNQEQHVGQSKPAPRLDPAPNPTGCKQRGQQWWKQEIPGALTRVPLAISQTIETYLFGEIKAKTWDFTTAGGQMIQSEGVGMVKILLVDGSSIKLEGVALVPDCESNLISLGQLRESKTSYHENSTPMMLMQNGNP